MPQSSFYDGDAETGAAGEDWADWEVDLIVADYFGMLQAELVHQTFNKAAHNRALQGVIPRSRGAIEFKHSNISAVLERLGLPIVSGYKPPTRATPERVAYPTANKLPRHPQSVDGLSALPSNLGDAEEEGRADGESVVPNMFFPFGTYRDTVRGTCPDPTR